MIALLLLVKLFATFVLADNDNESLPPGLTRRVFYGDKAKVEDYPYFASLGNCGGVILSQIWIATAGHCVANEETRSPVVYVGGNTIENSINHSYTDFIVHPDYSETDMGITVNDIALVKLNTPLQFSEKVQPAQLPTSDAPRHAVLVTRGADETGTTSTHLTKVDRIILTPQECLSMISSIYNALFLLQNEQKLEKMMLCTRRRENLPSVCTGDSGSPLLNGNTLIGIHTVGSELCRKGKLSVETYVFDYVPWIRAHTGL